MELTSPSFQRAKVALLEKALEGGPERPDLRYELAELLLDQGETDKGVQHYRKAYLQSPEMRPNPALDWIDDTGFVEAAYHRASTLIEDGVNFSAVIWAKLVTALLLDKHDEVAELADFPELYSKQLSPFKEANDPAFLDALASEIRSGMKHHQLKEWTAIKEASRNSEVFTCGLPACTTLAERISEQVQAYVATLRGSGKDHAFLRGIPDEAAISAWCVLLDGESRHISHIHPRAFMSGVFYVTKPDNLMDEHDGCFRAGPPSKLPQDRGWAEDWHNPTPGSLVLMPGYFSHETKPTRSNEERMCVAFDVMRPELAEGVGEVFRFRLR